MVSAQKTLDNLIPVRGISLKAPKPEYVDAFIRFIEEELVPRNVNTLLLRVDHNYEFKSRPELTADDALSEKDVKKLVTVCKYNKIRLIPLMIMLSHQSIRGEYTKLLEFYPEFNETPHIHPDSVYGLSYCPRHPELHNVLFDIIDEVVEVFEADAFHAGMDEVMIIGDDKCPRCRGRDKAELFAAEVRKLHDHLSKKDVELWIWGDRLLDGVTTGIGYWEASLNNTHRAIDMIPKDVVITDWHYYFPHPTASYFALKGFRVISCPFNRTWVGQVQLKNMIELRKYAPEEVKDRYLGMMQTVWRVPIEDFIEQVPGRMEHTIIKGGDQVECFIKLFEEINSLPLE